MSIKAAEVASAGSKFLGVKYSEMDCQAFVEACLKRAGLVMDLRGANAWYRKMTWTGTPEECKRKFGRVPVGAFLFIWNDDGGEVARGYHDGLGNASHIGIRTERGAIHSSQSRGCVATSEFHEKSIRGGWNRVGLWDRLDYGEAINRMISGGESGEEEKEMEKVKVSGGNTEKPINMRAMMSSASRLVAEIPQGAEVMLVSWGTVWSEVQYNGLSGYVRTMFIQMKGQEDGETIQISAELARQLKVILDELAREIQAQTGRG